MSSPGGLLGRSASGGVLAVVLALVAAACGSTEPVVFQVIEETTFAEAFVGPDGDTLTFDLEMMTELPSGVYIQDLVVDGMGALLAPGDGVTIDHTGWLSNGQGFSTGQFSTVHLADPPQLIPGFDAGMVGMRVGGSRLIIIPPEQGYGDRANRGIPAGSILIFVVDLLAIN